MSAVLVLCTSCLFDTTAVAPTPTSTRTAAASARPAREPLALLELPQEKSVVTGVLRAGLVVRQVGASKFETLLGARRQARVFTVEGGGGLGGADIVFTEEAIGDVRVCGVPGSIGRTVYTISLNGATVSTNDAGQAIFYSVGPGYFVQAYDAPTSDALRRFLGLSAPEC